MQKCELQSLKWVRATESAFDRQRRYSLGEAGDALKIVPKIADPISRNSTRIGERPVV
jgi:hypothetical protein